MLSLKKVRTVIIFGSFSKGDWYKNSDIDLFIFGDEKDLNLKKYELKLGRDIQTFICKDKKELKKFNNRLIRNIVRGDFVKGDLSFLEVGING